MTIPFDMSVGSKFSTNRFGELEVVKYINAKSVLCKFLNTGFVGSFAAGNIRLGKCKDPYAPSVYGVGYLGAGIFKVRENGRLTKSYSAWACMIERCYSPSFQDKNKTYSGCLVCDEWHNYQNFAKWHYENYDESSGRVQVDKDIKVSGNKIYSPETCLMVSHKENSAHAHAKNYRVTSPDGKVFNVHNLRDFCMKNEIDYNAMMQIKCGSSRRKTSGEWKFE